MSLWDKHFHLPTPPLDMVAPPEASFWTTVVFSVLTLALVIYGLKHWRDTGRPTILMLIAGGIVTVLIEPFVDVIGCAWHPVPGQDTAFSLMGRDIPVWVVAAYAFYFGVLGSLTLLAFERGVTMRQAWLWFLVPAVIDVLMEEIMMHWDLYHYYGNQPLILLINFPWWWSACNSIGEFIGVATIALLLPWMRGFRLLWMLLILPIADAVGYAAVGLPTIYAVNQADAPYWLVQACGVATLCLTALAVYGVSLLVASDSPLSSLMPSSAQAQTASKDVA